MSDCIRHSSMTIQAFCHLQHSPSQTHARLPGHQRDTDFKDIKDIKVAWETHGATSTNVDQHELLNGGGGGGRGMKALTENAPLPCAMGSPPPTKCAKNTPDIHEHWLMVHKGNRVRACADPFLYTQSQIMVNRSAPESVR